jgi:hypothetical protein
MHMTQEQLVFYLEKFRKILTLILLEQKYIPHLEHKHGK